MLPQLQSYDLETGELLCLNERMRGKYTLIDFWGSWCNPCIATITKLKELYEKIKHRDDVLIIGIALENQADLPKLKAIIEEQGIEWFNVWNSAKAHKSLDSPHGKLKINSYPSYVMVDKNGRIAFTSTDATCVNKDFVDRFLDLIN